MNHDEIIQLRDLIDKVSVHAHTNSRNHGFWRIVGVIESLPDPKDRAELRAIFKLSRTALFHEEVSECVRGIRKKLQDDHLPTFSMEVAELADVLIRIFDYAGGYGLPLGEALIKKMEYNAKRPHMHGDKLA